MAVRRTNITKLSEYGKTPFTPATAKAETHAAPGGADQIDDDGRSPEVIEELPPTIPPTKRTKAAKPKATERMVTINIKIPQSQQDWLADTARDVRANNDDPVPSSDRVYPQHLVQAAVDLLKASNVDWAEVRNIKDLRDQLNL